MKLRVSALLLLLVTLVCILTVTASAEVSYEAGVYTLDENGALELLQIHDGTWIVPYTPGMETVVHYYHGTPSLGRIEFKEVKNVGTSGMQLPSMENTEVLNIYFNQSTPGIQSGRVWMTCNGQEVDLKLLFVPEAWAVLENAPLEERLLSDSRFSDYQLKEVDGVLDYSPYGPAAFEYDGTTYYLGMMLAIEKKPYAYGGEPVVAKGQLTPRSMKAGIWTFDKKSGYTLVEDLSLFPEEFLASIAMDFYAEYDEGEYPILAERQDALPGLEVCFTDDCHNAWYPVITAELDGETITAVARFEWIVSYPQDFFLPDGTDVRDINDLLSALAEADHADRTVLQLFLPPQVSNSEGLDIVIPEELNKVSLIGFKDYPNQIYYTTIYNCGIEANCSQVDLSYLNLIGITQEELQKEEPQITEGKRGFYGSAQSQYRNCQFSWFDVGVEFGDECSNGQRFGGEHVIIRNCTIGYLMDNTTTKNGGNVMMVDFLFEQNDIAVFLKSISTQNSLKPYQYVIDFSIFRDNRVDVKNQTGRWFFFPGNEISHTNGPVSARAVEISHTPALEGDVSVYPVAVNLFEGTYLYEESGILSNELTYAIPTDQITDQEFAIVEEDTFIAAYTFDSAQTTPELMPLSMVSLTDAEETFFDPSVQLNRTSDEITLVLNTLPEGRSVTVFVPCTWEAVTVRQDGAEINAEADGQIVTFSAAEGGSYVITEREAEPEAPPQIPVKPPVSVNPDQQEQPSLVKFFDVPENSWFAKAVRFVCEKGLMKGMGNGLFRPDASASRAMVITMLARLDGVDTEGGSVWYEKAVTWAIRTGVSDGSQLDASITRQQLVTMLWRFAGSPKPKSSLHGYRDLDQIADYAIEAMTWAVEQKIIQGIGDGLLDPNGTATRAQIAEIFRNYLS